MSLLKNINNNISSIIGPEMEINGNVSVKGDLLIYGTIHGDVKSDSDIISAKDSVVNGNIESRNASISGVVKGSLAIQSKVTLKKDQDLNSVFKVFSDLGLEISSMRNETGRLEELFLGLVDATLTEKKND